MTQVPGMHKLTTNQRINLTKLANALESGKYKQQIGSLHNDTKNTFCCLGVACDLSKLGIWKPGARTDATYFLTDENQNCNGWLESEIIRDLYGFNDYRGWLGVSLADMNDSGSTFVEIAQEIRTYMMEH